MRSSSQTSIHGMGLMVERKKKQRFVFKLDKVYILVEWALLEGVLEKKRGFGFVGGVILDVHYYQQQSYW